jgi:hypothetical protein
VPLGVEGHDEHRAVEDRDVVVGHAILGDRTLIEIGTQARKRFIGNVILPDILRRLPRPITP